MIPSMQTIIIMYHEFFLLLQVDVQYLQQHDLLFKKMHDEIMQFCRQAPSKKIVSIPEIKKISLKKGVIKKNCSKTGIEECIKCPSPHSLAI